MISLTLSTIAPPSALTDSQQVFSVMIYLVIKDVTIPIRLPFSEKGGPMPLRRVRWFPVLLVVSALPVTPVGAQKAPALPDLLKVAGDYVTQYAHQLGAVAADEEFMQY